MFDAVGSQRTASNVNRKWDCILTDINVYECMNLVRISDANPMSSTFETFRGMDTLTFVSKIRNPNGVEMGLHHILCVSSVSYDFQSVF